MVCIYCKGSTSVINSRQQKSLNQVWRRRQCAQCGAVLTTHETFDHEKGLMLSTQDGKLIPFKKEKLFLSVLKTCEHRKGALDDAIALTDTIVTKVIHSLSSGSTAVDTVAMFTYATLLNFDKVSAIQYAAYHPGFDYEDR